MKKNPTVNNYKDGRKQYRSLKAEREFTGLRQLGYSRQRKPA